MCMYVNLANPPVPIPFRYRSFRNQTEGSIHTQAGVTFITFFLPLSLELDALPNLLRHLGLLELPCKIVHH